MFFFRFIALFYLFRKYTVRSVNMRTSKKTKTKLAVESFQMKFSMISFRREKTLFNDITNVGIIMSYVINKYN